MVALSPLPLDYLPSTNALTTKDPKLPEYETAELEVDIDVHNLGVSSDATSSSLGNFVRSFLLCYSVVFLLKVVIVRGRRMYVLVVL